MDCPACGSQNPEAARFCGDCGGTLAREIACPGCGKDVPAEKKFCHWCGHAMAGGLTAATVPTSPTVSVPPVSTPPTHAAPTSIGNGRYQIERFLGEGARKRVYLAQDTRLARDVALALIKTEGFDDAARQRVHREAQAMGRLGDHAHIVTVHDIGEDGEQLYIVGEYMAGGDLAMLLHDADDGRLTIEEALRYGAQVCAALDHAHSRDIIHRDLKPGNVWLSSANNALLGDFGLAVDLERSRITQEGIMLGTVAYMPPEQALGRPADARSDLYALGAMLYEMVTGRTPFQGDDAVAIITQHINTPPVHPAWHNSQVPASLDALIMELLAKAPDDRPASAAAVGLRLQQIAAESGETAVSVSMQAPAAGVGQGRIAWGQFVGRAEELGGLKAGVDEALSGRGNLRLLVGEPGIGKTRTAEELATYAKLRGAQVLMGKCYEGAGAPPYWPWVQVVRAYVQEQPPAQLRSDMGPGAADIAQVVSDVGAALPDLEPPPKLDPEQAQFRLFDSVTTFLKNVSVRDPLVLILDDLHWADKPSLLLLQFLVRELGGTRIAILGTYRDVELDRTHPLADVLANLRRERLYQRVLLRGLSAGEVRGMLENMARQEVGEPGVRLAEAIHRETEGNPFFVEEVILHLAETEAIYRDEQGQWVTRTANPEELGIPEGVREVVGRRLSRLSDACNTMLGIAAVIGRDFDLAAVQRASDLDGDALYAALEEAENAGIIAEQREQREQRDRYRFSHALLKETLYEELSTPVRVRLHRRVGETLERVHADSIEAHLPELAYHFTEGAQAGGDLEKAIDYAVRAAERAKGQVAYEEAAAHYKRALQALELQQPLDEARQAGFLLAQGEALGIAGDQQRAEEALLRCTDVARGIGAGTVFAKAAVLFAQHRQTFGVADEQGVALLEEGLALLPATDSVERVMLLNLCSTRYRWSRDTARTLRAHTDAKAMAGRLGDPQARYSALRAGLLFTERPPVDKIGDAESMFDLGSAAAQPLWQDWGLFMRNLYAVEAGDLETAGDVLARLRTLAESTRLPHTWWHVGLIDTQLAQLAGRFDEAERLNGSTLEIGRQLVETNALQYAAVVRVTVEWLKGRFGDRVDMIESLMEGYEEVPAYISMHARALLAAGREDDARAQYERLAAEDFIGWPFDIATLCAWVWLSETAILLQDMPRAQVLYDLLSPYADQVLMVGLNNVCWGSTALWAGKLAAALGRTDEAEAHYVAALEMNEHLGARPFVALTQADYARMLLDRGRPEDRGRAMELANGAAGTAQEIGMQGVLEQALAIKLELQGMSGASDRHGSIDLVAATVQAEQPDLKPHAAPDGTVTILFSDIEGYTAMTERLGDFKMQDVLREHNRIVREQVHAHGGYEVKSEGDGFMLAFGSARKAIDCAVAMQRAFADHSKPEDRETLRVRMGLHTGEVIKEADDFFGKNVILAARIAGQAEGGEILVSSLVKNLTESAGDLAFTNKRKVELKGLTGEFSLHPIRWA